MASGRVPKTSRGRIFCMNENGQAQYRVSPGQCKILFGRLKHQFKQAGDCVKLDRRTFIQSTGATVAGMLLAHAPRAGRAAPAGPETLVEGKDPRLIVHASQPAVFETPAELLATEQITPTSLLFVRNNQQPSDANTIKPASLSGWKVEVAGLVDRPLTIDAADLLEMPQVAQEMVLQCSGNSRSLFAASAPTKGTPWGRGGMGNVSFQGVQLSTLLQRLSIQVKPDARHLTAEGSDAPAPGEQDFEHSIPLADALKKSLLALKLNGEALPAIHGGPLRLVTPGYYGTMHVKWLTRLRFDVAESDHTSQVPHYRTPLAPIDPGKPFVANLENSEPNWRMKIKCVVLSPSPGARLTSGLATVQGVAFNDGEARIDSVLVSPDAGQTWQPAELQAPASPYAWYRWTAKLRLPPGAQQIWAMAIDALGRTQPRDGAVHWNPQGYTWNGVEKISVEVS